MVVNIKRSGFNQIQNSNSTPPATSVMMNQRPNVMGNSTPTNTYVGQPVRPGGPGMSPQQLGQNKRPGDMRAPNQAGKM